MYTIHATRKLLDRIKRPVEPPIEQPSTALGNWYATAIFTNPQVALFVNELTLLPVVVPLAPARTLALRFPDQLGMVLERLGTPLDFLLQEVEASRGPAFATTASRSILGSMNDFVYHARWRMKERRGDEVAISVQLARTPCGPLRERHVTPKRELEALVSHRFGGR